jgi:hypothetical protein
VSDELVPWLRAEIEADKRAASVKIIRQHWSADPGSWATGTGIVGEDGGPVAVAIGDYAAHHIVRHDPLDVLADCAAKLAVLEEHKSSGGMYPTCRTCADWSPGTYMGDEEEWEEPPDDVRARAHPCKTVRLLGWGYRYRDGFNPSWLDM